MFGDPGATRLLVVVSGMHGVESLPGAAIQVGWIESGGPDLLPEDTAVLMVHQANPWGCAFRRRFNEDNVDLNRNFLDFSEPLPGNDKYASVHDTLGPDSALGDFGERSGEFLGALVAQDGIEYVVDLLMAGQHQYPDGFGYGGQAPVWSNELLEQVMADHAPGRERVCYLELHSGLGPYGYGQLISLQLGACLDRTRDWFGQWVSTPEPTNVPVKRVTGRCPGTAQTLLFVTFQSRGHPGHPRNGHLSPRGLPGAVTGGACPVSGGFRGAGGKVAADPSSVAGIPLSGRPPLACCQLVPGLAGNVPGTGGAGP